MATNRAYDDDEADEDAAKDKGHAVSGAPTQPPSGNEAGDGAGGEEEAEDSRPRKRRIQWLDETAGYIESYDCKRQKAVDAGLEAQVCLCIIGWNARQVRKSFVHGGYGCIGYVVYELDCACQGRYVECQGRYVECWYTSLFCVTPCQLGRRQKPMSAWALKLKEEQKAFAEAMSSMKGMHDD